MNDDTPLQSCRYRVVAWPSGWEERVRGWKQGLGFRLGWGARRVGSISPACCSGPLLAARSVLAHPALIGPNRHGRLMAFSAQAVNQARIAWDSLGIRRIYGGAWQVSWLNDVRVNGTLGFPASRGIPGLDVVDLGQQYVLFCPEVLGPLGTIPIKEGLPSHFQPSLGLEVKFLETGIALRGAALLDGWWRSGRIVPEVGEGGWMFLPIHPLMEEVLDDGNRRESSGNGI